MDFLEKSKTFNHVFFMNEPYEKSESPPLPLITSTLQQLSNNKLNFSPKKQWN